MMRGVAVEELEVDMRHELGGPVETPDGTRNWQSPVT